MDNSELAIPPGLEVTARVVFTGQPLQRSGYEVTESGDDDVTPGAAATTLDTVAEFTDRIIVAVDAKPIDVPITVLVGWQRSGVGAGVCILFRSRILAMNIWTYMNTYAINLFI